MGYSKWFFALGGRILRRLNLQVSPNQRLNLRPGVNLNVGCGNYEIHGFIGLDLFTETYYSNQLKNRLHYDMRNDELPFDSDSVDAIYCSHVIEHIETEHVIHFFKESFRVLKRGSHLRIVCPDSLFLFQQVTHSPDYFSWHPLFASAEDAMLCFVDEVASHRAGLENFGIVGNPLELDFQTLTGLLREGGRFDASSPSRHINNWSFSRIEALARDVGWSKILESKNKGASSPLMQGLDMDLTHPEMSLYVDLIK